MSNTPVPPARFPARFPARTFLLLSWLFCHSSVLLATPPRGLLTLPDGPIPIESLPKEDPAGLKAFQNMINGTTDAVPTDPIMSGLMQVYYHRGSVLENSSLDPRLQRSHATPEPIWNRSGDAQQRHKRLHAAELLLKTSRLIDKIKPLSDNRRQLAVQMRQEAARLLTQPTPTQPTFAPTPKSVEPQAEPDLQSPAETPLQGNDIPVPNL